MTKVFVCLSLFASAVLSQAAFAQSSGAPAPSPLQNPSTSNPASTGTQDGTPAKQKHHKHSHASIQGSPPSGAPPLGN